MLICYIGIALVSKALKIPGWAATPYNLPQINKISGIFSSGLNVFQCYKSKKRGSGGDDDDVQSKKHFVNFSLIFPFVFLSDLFFTHLS